MALKALSARLNLNLLSALKVLSRPPSAISQERGMKKHTHGSSKSSPLYNEVLKSVHAALLVLDP
eukprot:1142849-Pelagomonas_calceolata.AAC.1